VNGDLFAIVRGYFTYYFFPSFLLPEIFIAYGSNGILFLINKYF